MKTVRKLPNDEKSIVVEKDNIERMSVISEVKTSE